MLSRVIAKGMLIQGTPLEDHQDKFGLYVKREDLSCPSPGPHFSKARGVYARIKRRPESIIGVLDTRHSQAGHAVARACQILGKKCVNYYPEYKHDKEMRRPQLESQSLGADLHPLPAGRSCILFHAAKRHCESMGGYMMPNALKLHESVEETAKEVPDQRFDYVLIPISSGTIAAGVVRGFQARIEEGSRKVRKHPQYIIHMGYSRSHDEVEKYIRDESGVDKIHLELIDEGYDYKDKSVPGSDPDWPCNEYYDLKAFRWWTAVRDREEYQGRKVLFWNIG